VTIMAMALMALVVVVIVARLTTGRIDAALRDQVAATDASLTRGRDGTLTIAHTRADSVVDSVWVYDPDGTQVAGPQAGDRIQDTVDELGRVTTSTQVQRRDRVYYAVPVRLAGDAHAAGVVVASEDVEAYEGTRALLITGLAVLGALVTAVTGAITAWTVKRSLEPVEQMTRLADLWSELNIDSRFELGTGRDELTRLGNTLDRLLDRVAEAIRDEQQLTGELAHELRTPLTTIRAEAELGIMAGVDRSTHQRLERVVEQVERLTATINTLLAVARHEHGGSYHCDVETVVGGLVESHAGGTPITVDANAARSPTACSDTDDGDRRDDSPPQQGIQVAADALLVERVLGPVLDNAVRLATSRVWLTVRREGRIVVIDICDDGPGIRDTERIFEAGAVDGDFPGAGLGLPLARRVVASIGGSVTVASVCDPTIFSIHLPAR
jgi:two-component system OmpR family sensor kinase